MGPVGWVHAIWEFLPEESYQALLSVFLAQRWTRLMEEMAGGTGMRSIPATFFTEAGDYFRTNIEPSYRTEGRSYHVMSHLAHCLSEMDALIFNCPARPEAEPRTRQQLELAIFFHDLVYRGGPLPVLDGEGDEEASARYATDFLKDTARTTEEFHLPVEGAILGTQYCLADITEQEGLVPAMRDIDLSILGRPGREYSHYMRAIRDEYRDIPFPLYAAARSRILGQFQAKAERQELFALDWFVSRGYNQQAVHNLRMELEHLGTEREQPALPET